MDNKIDKTHDTDTDLVLPEADKSDAEAPVIDKKTEKSATMTALFHKLPNFGFHLPHYQKIITKSAHPETDNKAKENQGPPDKKFSLFHLPHPKFRTKSPNDGAEQPTDKDKQSRSRLSVLHPLQNNSNKPEPVREPTPEPVSFFDFSDSPPPSPRKRVAAFIQEHCHFHRKPEQEEVPEPLRAPYLWQCYRCDTYCLEEQEVCVNCGWNPRC